MSNFLKLLSKIVLAKVKPMLMEKRLISENQGVFGDNTIGSKELVLLDEVIQGQHKGKLATAWLDVKKAFDSVPHKYVLIILKKLPINKAILKLIERIYSVPSTRLEVLTGQKFQRIGSIPLKKGVIQIDSMAPLLFILAMQPLTRLLHKEFESFRMGDSSDSMELNYLLYMDDLKQFARGDSTLTKLLQVTESFFVKIGFNLNASKSARTYCYGGIS